jgi:hypothetical protein
MPPLRAVPAHKQPSKPITTLAEYLVRDAYRDKRKDDAYAYQQNKKAFQEKEK